MSDDTPDARERAEAEALARALDGQPGPEAPADALEAAVLLRHARHGRATPSQLERVRARLLERPRFTPVRVAAVASFAAAALALLVWLPSRQTPEAVPVAARQAAASRPSSAVRALLEAQGAALREPERPLDGLAAATALRRRELLAGLEERYGGSP